jgi:hypothetical protein
VPVDPDDVDAIAAALGGIYREAELALYRALARHFERYPGAPSAWAEPRLEAVGQLRRSVEVIHAGLQADGSRAAREAVAQAYQLGDRSALADIPARWAPNSGVGVAAEAARAYVPQTAAVEALAAAVVRDLTDAARSILRQALDAYRGAVAGAVARMAAAGVTRREATQAAWSALVKRGIFGFTDRSGRRWRLSSYAEMAVRTGAARAAVTGQTDRLASLGIDLVYVSDHVQECAICAPWEGRVLRRDAGPTGRLVVPHALDPDRTVEVDVVDTLDDARTAGLFHPNCRHSVSGFLAGVTRPPRPRAHSPEQYAARMNQRELERRIRAAREDAAAAITPDAQRAANAVVRRRQAAMRAHLAAHPYLTRQRPREQIGAGNTPPAERRDDAVTPIGPDVQPGLAPDAPELPLPRGTRRTEEPDPAPTAAPTAPAAQPELGELTDAEVRALPDDVLDTRLGETIAVGDYGSRAARQLRREADRRDRLARQRDARRRAVEQRDRARHERMAELVEQGVPWEAAAAEVLGTSVEAVRRQAFTQQQRAGAADRRTFVELAREQYRLDVERRYVAAETATRGYLLNAAGEAAGVDPMSLFSGPRSRVERYASEELRRWFDEHGRETFAEFVAAIEAGRRTSAPGRDYNR